MVTTTYSLESGVEIALTFISPDSEDTVVNFGFPEALLGCVYYVKLLSDDNTSTTIGELFDRAGETSFLSVTAVKHHLSRRSKDDMWPTKKDSWEMT